MESSTATNPATAQPSEEHEAPVEMSDLPPPQTSTTQPTEDGEVQATAGASQPHTSSSPTEAISQPPPARANSEAAPALGPATDSPIVQPPTDTSTAGPTLSITLMLTTGARHPYNITKKYLESRKVAFPNTGTASEFDPRDITGYKLKELIWTDWRTAEWEPRPASPSAIRLIILGRLVDDNVVLRDLPFKLDAPNVLHMTVKPADFLDDDEATAKTSAKSRGSRRRGSGGGEVGEERGAGCRCVIL